jgi:D-3-phosphoglycerate dehydrogenase
VGTVKAAVDFAREFLGVRFLYPDLPGYTPVSGAATGTDPQFAAAMALAKPFGWRMLAADPYADPAAIRALGAEPMALDDMLPQADFVVATCLLNAETRHLMNARRFSLMKREAFFINMARGPVADEAALIDALRAGTIAGAGLDVFEQEPVATDNPLLTMEQVILTPHALCWTDECFDAIAREGLGCIVDFAQGRQPRSVVRPG